MNPYTLTAISRLHTEALLREAEQERLARVALGGSESRTAIWRAWAAQLSAALRNTGQPRRTIQPCRACTA